MCVEDANLESIVIPVTLRTCVQSAPRQDRFAPCSGAGVGAMVGEPMRGAVERIAHGVGS
jgi:hypothetical protein